MRFRLFHKIFLLVSLTAIISVLAVASLMSANLDRGFSAYLEARDEEQLVRLADEARLSLESRGGAAALASGELSLISILPDRNMAGPPRRLSRPRQRAAPEGPDTNRPPRRPRRGGPPESFEPRLLLFNAAGDQLAGPPLPPGGANQRMLTQPLIVDETTVGSIKLLPRPPAPDAIDTQFLRQQFMGAALLTGILIALAAVAAFWLARRSSRAFTRLGAATDAIRQGDFATRVEIHGKDELAEMAGNINAMAASLAKMEAARKRWLAEIGHELRTPLAVLSGELEALRDGIRPMDQTAVSSLIEESERLNLLIGDLHFLAVSDMAEPLYTFHHADGVAIVTGVAARMREFMSKADLNLTVDAGDLRTLTVVWDSTRIEQMLANLVENSRRYTNAPGTVELKIRKRGDVAVIMIADSAPGVPPQHLANLFEPLYRIEEARDRASGGSGLGLAVCEAIVRGHGGKMTASDSTLGGLCITIELPLQAVSESTQS